MKSRIKGFYLCLGNILNNPEAFGLGERPPKTLADTLTRMQSELMEELREEASDEDVLSRELSQDSDGHSFPAVTSTSFRVRKTGT